MEGVAEPMEVKVAAAPVSRRREPPLTVSIDVDRGSSRKDMDDRAPLGVNLGDLARTKSMQQILRRNHLRSRTTDTSSSSGAQKRRSVWRSVRQRLVSNSSGGDPQRSVAQPLQHGDGSNLAPVLRRGTRPRGNAWLSNAWALLARGTGVTDAVTTDETGYDDFEFEHAAPQRATFLLAKQTLDGNSSAFSAETGWSQAQQEEMPTKASRCKCTFFHIKILILFLLVKKLASVAIALIGVSMFIKTAAIGLFVWDIPAVPFGFAITNLSITLATLAVFVCWQRRITAKNMLVTVYFGLPIWIMPSPILQSFFFLSVLLYALFRNDTRARTLVTITLDAFALVLGAISLALSPVVDTSVLAVMHGGNGTGVETATVEWDVHRSDVLHIALRGFCGAISMGIVVADIIRICNGFKSGHSATTHKWITYDQLVHGSDCPDTLDIVVESETNHWTAHVQHYFARSAWTHVAVIVRDPPRSVIRAYGLEDYAAKMPEHAHVFVYEAVRPRVRLVPLREYMRFKQRTRPDKVLALRRMHMDRRAVDWLQLEQLMLDLVGTDYCRQGGTMTMIKANYQLNEQQQRTDVTGAYLVTPYNRHHLVDVACGNCDDEESVRMPLVTTPVSSSPLPASSDARGEASDLTSADSPRRQVLRQQLAALRACSHIDILPTPGIYCSHIVTLVLRAAGVQQLEYENILSRAATDYTPHDYGDPLPDIAATMRAGAWLDDMVVRIRDDNRFTLNRMRSITTHGIGEFVQTPFGPAVLDSYLVDTDECEGFAHVHLQWGAQAWIKASLIRPCTRMAMSRYHVYDCADMHSWWLRVNEMEPLSYIARSHPKDWHATRA